MIISNKNGRRPQKKWKTTLEKRRRKNGRQPKKTKQKQKTT
jgi:hypothetical protein